MLQHLCGKVVHMLGLVRDDSKPHVHRFHTHSEMIDKLGSFPFSLVRMAPKAERLHELRDPVGFNLAVLRSSNFSIQNWDDQEVIDLRQYGIAV